VKSGYTITYAGAGPVVTAVCNGAANAAATYFAAAAPVAAGTSGTRFFGTSESQTIFQDIVAIVSISTSGAVLPATAVAIK
jgi:hypothetical protein